MAKVTSKLQVTIPKSLATHFGIRSGDDIEWVQAGDAIRIIPRREIIPQLSVEERLKLFDEATRRQRQRERCSPTLGAEPVAERGWSRDELYDRGRTG